MIKTVSPKNFSSTNGGTFEGWGTSLCWWAHRVGYSESLSEKAAELFFSKEGLGLNIMRYNIGGGDDPEHKHIKRSDSAIPGFLKYNKVTGEKTWDYEADSNQLRVLEKAYKAAADDAYVEVFSNSPPYFMTVSGCSSGSIDAKSTNLKDECVSEFADYLAEVSRYIEKEKGIRIKSVAPMNEPDTAYWKMNSPKQEGCHIDPGERQSRVITETRRAFDEKGLNHIIVAASDETSTERQINSYKLYTDEAKKAIGRISTHSYITCKSKKLGKLRKKEGFNLWMSEVDGSGVIGRKAGDMRSALWYAKKIISDINALSPSAWVTWLVIDLHRSQTGYGGNPDYGKYDEKRGFWGLSCCDHDREEILLSQKYYAYGQFSRYIRPKMTLIHIDENALGAYNKETNEVVIVVVNPKGKLQGVDFDLSEFAIDFKESRVIETSGNTEGGKKWSEGEKLTVKNNILKVTLNKYSVTTFVVSPVAAMG